MEYATTQINATVLHRYPDDTHVIDRWREFLTRADFAAHYVSPEYFREPFFHDKKQIVLLAWLGDRVAAVLSGTEEGQEFSCGLMSRPQLCLDTTADLAGVSDALVAG